MSARIGKDLRGLNDLLEAPSDRVNELARRDVDLDAAKWFAAIPEALIHECLCKEVRAQRRSITLSGHPVLGVIRSRAHETRARPVSLRGAEEMIEVFKTP
jgi:hypothetical protein